MKTFHGNFFIRSTDLLSIPVVPIDQSYSMEVQVEDDLTAPFVVFQTAVMHTTCFGTSFSLCSCPRASFLDLTTFTFFDR